MKTGILVHGCNLDVENWRHIAWGDPPNQLGRISHGIMVASQMDADVIVFGTGASSKEFRLGNNPQPGTELFEAEYSLEYLKQHFENLRKFDSFRDLKIPNSSTSGNVSESAWETWKESMLSKVVLDIESQNTTEEIRSAGKVFVDCSIQRVVLVSSPSHIVRSLRDATSIFSSEPKFNQFAQSLYASPSVTCYEGSSPGDVVVVEPPSSSRSSCCLNPSPNPKNADVAET